MKPIKQPNYKPREHNHKDIDYGKSKTIPNQAFTIKRIMEMAKQGINLGQMREAVFEGEEFPEGNPLRKQNFDLSDIDLLKAENARVMDYLEKVKKLENSKKNEAKKAEERKQIIAEYEAQKAKGLDSQKNG